MNDTAQEKISENVSVSASARSARLCAVQCLYEILHRQAPLKEVIKHYLDNAEELELHGEPQVKPNGALMKSIVCGVDERSVELSEILVANLPGLKDKKSDMEILLKSILLCGAYEILAHHDIDSPIIINDYVDIAHAFYEEGQAKLVNGVLDTIKGLLR